MKQRFTVWTFFLIVFISVIMTGCQDVFTFSPFASLGRDPSTLSDDQKINYANNVLAGGSQEEMAEAYALINEMLAEDPNNGDLHLLAAELAIGASGLGDATSSLDPSSADAGSLDTLLEGLDGDMLAATATHVRGAESADAEVSDSQYVNAGMALIAKEAKDAGGFSEIDWENPNENVESGINYAEKGGVDIESLVGG